MSVVKENKTGRVETFFDTDSGKIMEDGSGDSNEFFQPGASVSFVVGDAVSYLKVTLPTGGVIIKDIKKGGA